MAIINIPDAPAIGLPENTKSSGKRVDFKPDDFALAIETKGYLLLWERAIECPCTPVTTQTEQPDPNCELCKGIGVIYFGASDAQILSEYTLNDLQQHLVDTTGGMVIRGLINTVTSKQNPYDVIGKWVEGSANLTVRHENRVGYYDKITSLDSRIVFKEVIVADGTNTLPTRYPVIGVNYMRTVDTEYTSGAEFYIENGVITWHPGNVPDENTRFAVHYLCHPTWLIIEHPHAVRVTSNLFKTKTPTTPTGEPRQLPIQAAMRYDFMPSPE